MPSKARMTIRFDPPPTRSQPTPPERPAAVETAPIDDANALEQLIRQAGPALPGQASSPVTNLNDDKAASVPDNKRFEPAPAAAVDKQVYSAVPSEDVLPTLPAHPQIEIVHDGLRSHQTSPAWWKVILSAASAIATGALFGFLVLSLFSNSSPGFSLRSGEPATQTAMSQQSASYIVSSDDQQDAAGADLSQGVPPAQADQAWPAATWYWLQYGVFRSQEAMEAAAAELTAAGLPAFSDQAEGFRVYAGVAATKEMAEQLASQMPDRELFIKPIIMPEVHPAAHAGGEDWHSFIILSEQLAASLSSLSVSALQDKMPQPADEAVLGALREGYSQWQHAAATVERLEGAAYAEGMAIIQALSDAMSSIDQYERNVSRYHLWRIQAQLMKKLAAERRLRETAVVQS